VSEELPTLIDVGGFDAVDGSAGPERYAAWMDRQRAGVGDPMLGALDLGPDDDVLDIGCGTGVDLAAIAPLVRRTVGVDRSQAMARSAVERLSDSGALLAVADGERLPFRDASLDVVIMRAVLVHTSDPRRTMAEMRRVLRPGGRVLLSEPDHGSHVVATPELDVLQRLLAHRRTTFRNPLVGRSLPLLAAEVGLTVGRSRALPIVHRTFARAEASGGPFGVAVEQAVTAGAITEEEAARYLASLRDLDARGAFLFTAQAIAVVATLEPSV
jgi:SAM-dependent methyltransferase